LLLVSLSVSISSEVVVFSLVSLIVISCPVAYLLTSLSASQKINQE